MTRTRRVISVLGAALLVLSGHSSEVRGQDSEVGVEATYSLVFSLPFMNQNGTLFVKYLVTKDELCTHVDWDVGFINGVMRPGPTGITCHDDGNAFEFSSPFMEPRSGDRNKVVEPRSYDSQGYVFWNLAGAHQEASVWQALNSDAAQAMIQSGSPSFATEVSSKGRQFMCNGSMTYNRDSLDSLSVSVAPGWNRVYREFQQLVVGNVTRNVATECVMHVPNGDLASFDQGPVDGRFPGSHDRYADVGLLYHRGGRHVQTSWKSDGGVIVPERVRITLGSSGKGMLLREARLISSRTLPVGQVRQKIAALKSQTKRDEAPLGANKFISKYFWPKSPGKKTEQAQEIEQRLRSEIASRLKSVDLTVGDDLGFTNTLVYLDCLTDTSPDLNVTKSDLRKMVDLLGKHSGAESQAAAVFNFLEMSRFLRRQDLEQLGTNALDRILSSLEPATQLRVLFCVSGATETQDIRLLQLMKVSQRCLESNSVPESEIRATLSLLEQKALSFHTTGLFASRGKPDPQHLVEVRGILVDELNRLIDQLNLSRSTELQRAADRLGQLLPVLLRDSADRR